jgi:putative ABC transport system permease protein
MLTADLRYGLRSLRRTPVFAGAAILTVALTAGANTTIFSVVNAVLIRPLPFSAPNRLMQVAEKNDRLKLSGFSVSLLNYLTWREQSRDFEGLAAFGSANYALTGRGDPEQFQGGPITPSLLPVLGVAPVAGRGFSPEEERPGGAPVVLISEALWKRRFGGDRSILGTQIMLNGISRTVVGVAPPALPFLTGGDVWIPQIVDPGRENRLNHVLTAVGRLRPGVSPREAQAEMDAISARAGIQYPEVKDWGVEVVTFDRFFVADQLRTALVVLMAAVGIVLLIAGANIANLLLARAAARQKEIAVRTALGASRARTLLQLLTESLLLAAVGGVAGVLTAAAVRPAITRALPRGLLPVSEIPLDSTVLLFALGVTAITGVLFGLAPALQASRLDIMTVLKQGGRSSIGGGRLAVRNLLVAGELALATMLLVGAGLLTQSLLRLERVPLGFQPERLLTFQLAPPAARYQGPARGWALYRRLLQAVESLPGVRGAAVSSGIPMGGGTYTRTPVMPVGKSELPDGDSLPIDWRIVSPGYFRAMGIPLVAGRDFNESDTPDSPPVLIVSRSTARRFWGDADPIGKVLRTVANKRDATVVGVAGDVRHNGLNQEYPSMYHPASFRQWPLMDVVVRTSGRPEQALAAVRARLREIDPELPLANVRTMEEWIANNAAQPRLNAGLLMVFAGVSLLIAAVGVYGVLAYAVSQSTREIGLRMALGAQRGVVVRWVAGRGMAVAGCGIAAGLAGAMALSRVLASLLFGVEPHDPATFAGVAAILGGVAVAACLLPAYRASRVDPLIALREE